MDLDRSQCVAFNAYRKNTLMHSFFFQVDDVVHGRGSAGSVRAAREEASRQTLIILGRA